MALDTVVGGKVFPCRTRRIDRLGIEDEKDALEIEHRGAPHAVSQRDMARAIGRDRARRQQDGLALVGAFVDDAVRKEAALSAFLPKLPVEAGE